MLRRLWSRMWYRILCYAISQGGARRISACANRYATRAEFGRMEAHLSIRDTSEPDGWSREELLEKLWHVRVWERRLKWKVPEPTENDVLAMEQCLCASCGNDKTHDSLISRNLFCWVCALGVACDECGQRLKPRDSRRSDGACVDCRRAA